MKKILALLLSFVMMLSLAACGGGSDAPASSSTSESESTTVETQPILYAGFYYATIPDGFDLDPEKGKFETKWLREADPDDQYIELQINSSFDKTPEESLSSLTEISNPYTMGESFEAGEYNWAYAYYDGALGYSVIYCTTTPDDALLRIETTNLEPKSDEAVAFLESVSMTEYAYDDYVEFYNAAKEK